MKNFTRYQKINRFLFIHIGAFMGLAMTGMAQASAPQAQAPGYYRMMLGDYEITAISDGTVTTPMDKLLIGPADEIKRLLAQVHLTPDVKTSINTFLIDTGNKLILVDTGAGHFFGPTAGHLLDNLRAAGYHPRDIDAVLLTHIHGDHSNGLTRHGKAVFPNATVYVNRNEAGFWLDADNAARVKPMFRDSFAHAKKELAPYLNTGRVELIHGGEQLFPGIHCIATPGHTLGHCVYSITSGGQRMLIIGDLVHCMAVQLPQPSISIKFDFKPQKAARQRMRILHMAARNGYWVAGMHIPFPGIGHVAGNGEGGYDWIPIHYSDHVAGLQ